MSGYDIAPIWMQCDHCGYEMTGRPGLLTAAVLRHEKKCEIASPEQRREFLASGKWPKDAPKIAPMVWGRPARQMRD